MKGKLSVFGIAMLCVASIGYDVMDSSAQSPISFKDTTEHWAEPSILTAVEKKYVDGYEDGTFKPDLPISRAEFIKMVALATGEKVNQAGGDGWFQPYVDRLKSLEIIPAEFPERYNEPLQRYEMSILSVRSVDKTLKGTMVDSTKQGLIHGVSRTDLDVYGTSTRAQAITIIERILAARNGEILPIDKYAASAAEIAATGSNVGTMLGLKALAIGQTWEYSKGVSATLNQLIIVDPNDSADPYLPIIDMRTWYSGLDKRKTFIVLARFTMEIKQEGINPEVTFFASQNFSLLDTKKTLLAVDDQQFSRVIRFDKAMVVSGYVAYVASSHYVQHDVITQKENIKNTDLISFNVFGRHVQFASGSNNPIASLK